MNSQERDKQIKKIVDWISYDDQCSLVELFYSLEEIKNVLNNDKTESDLFEDVCRSLLDEYENYIKNNDNINSFLERWAITNSRRQRIRIDEIVKWYYADLRRLNYSDLALHEFYNKYITTEKILRLGIIVFLMAIASRIIELVYDIEIR